MHLDLSPMLPAHASTAIDLLVSQLGVQHKMLWPRWINTVNCNETTMSVLQASAQQLAAHGCVISELMFGLMCSRNYPVSGIVLSDDAALFYLRRAFSEVSAVQGPILAWLKCDKRLAAEEASKRKFWQPACGIYLMYEFENDAEHFDSTIEFAMNQLMEDKHI